MRQNNQRGVLHEPPKSFPIALALVLMFITLHFALAQDSAQSSPDPAPTDAVKVSGRTLKVEGRASTRQGVAYARYAALLDSYSAMLEYGLKNGMFPGTWGSSEDGFRLYRVDPDHPAPDIISWISRSKVYREDDKDGMKILRVESPEMGTLATAAPEIRAMTTQDVDSDGLSDVVGVGYDGSIYIMKKAPGGESKIAARSQSYGLLEIVEGPGYERIRAVLPQDMGLVEVLEGGQARVLLELEQLEAVNGELMGRAVERREVLMPLGSGEERIRFAMSEPPDFARLFDPDVEIRGSAISEKTLENVVIRHNGKSAWESPQGLGIRALQFNLTSRLVPGWNSFRLTARDAEGFMQFRELWVEGPEGMPDSDINARRAVVVSLDDDLKKGRLVDALQDAGFNPEQVTVLQGQEATARGFLEAVRDNKDAEELLLYCETFTVPGSLIGGKTLRFPDGGQVPPSELAQAMDAGGYLKTLGLIYSELPRSDRGMDDSMELWRDTSTFLERLGSSGRLFISNVENVDESPRRQRQRSRDRLMDAIKKKEGSDLERLIDVDRPKNTLFRGWMYGSPVLR